jgi:hypothetical protein
VADVGELLAVLGVEEAFRLLPVVEPFALLVLGEPLALLEVDELLEPVKPVVPRDAPPPLILEYSVEPVPIVPRLERIVVCVAPVESEIFKRKAFVS